MTEAEWIAFLQRPEFPAFNRAMLENPADDLPRLVFADWLDENCPDTAVNTAVRESIAKPDARPFPQWPGRNGRLKHRLYFVRGRLRVGGEQKLAVPRNRPPWKLFEAAWRAGWVASLTFGQIGEKPLAVWAREPMLELLTEIVIYEENTNVNTVLTLLGSPHLLRIAALRIIGGWRPIEWLRALADLPTLTRLQRLTIVTADLRSDSFETLVRSPGLSGLKELSLPSCEIGLYQATALANSPHLSGLESLTLDLNGNVGAAALAYSPYLCKAIHAQWRRG